MPSTCKLAFPWDALRSLNTCFVPRLGFLTMLHWLLHVFPTFFPALLSVRVWWCELGNESLSTYGSFVAPPQVWLAPEIFVLHFEENFYSISITACQGC